MSNKEKIKYQKLATDDVERYNKQMCLYDPEFKKAYDAKKDAEAKKNEKQGSQESCYGILSLWTPYAQKAQGGVCGKVVPAGVALQIVSERWKKLTAAEKAKYEAMAKADKERYLKELKAYDPVKFKELQDQARERAGSKTSVNVRRKTDGPTKNLSAYYHFAREKRGEYKSQNMSHLDIQKQLRAMEVTC